MMNSFVNQSALYLSPKPFKSCLWNCMKTFYHWMTTITLYLSVFEQYTARLRRDYPLTIPIASILLVTIEPCGTYGGKSFLFQTPPFYSIIPRNPLRKMNRRRIERGMEIARNPQLKTETGSHCGGNLFYWIRLNRRRNFWLKVLKSKGIKAHILLFTKLLNRSQ